MASSPGVLRLNSRTASALLWESWSTKRLARAYCRPWNQPPISEAAHPTSAGAHRYIQRQPIAAEGTISRGHMASQMVGGARRRDHGLRGAWRRARGPHAESLTTGKTAASERGVRASRRALGANRAVRPDLLLRRSPEEGDLLLSGWFPTRAIILAPTASSLDGGDDAVCSAGASVCPCSSRRVKQRLMTPTDPAPAHGSRREAPVDPTSSTAPPSCSRRASAFGSLAAVSVASDPARSSAVRRLRR